MPKDAYKSFKERMKALATGVKYAVRGAQGLPPEEEDVYLGLVDVDDIRERTRLPSIHDVYAQEFMRLLKKHGGKEWAIMGEVADQDAHLFISIEGEQRREMILMKQKTTGILIPPGQPLTVPEVSTKLEKGEKGEKKKE